MAVKGSKSGQRAKKREMLRASLELDLNVEISRESVELQKSVSFDSLIKSNVTQKFNPASLDVNLARPMTETFDSVPTTPIAIARHIGIWKCPTETSSEMTRKEANY